jgi:hypothetical protein
VAGGWLCIQLSPYLGIDGDAEAEIFFAELQGLFAGVANGFVVVGWGCVFEGV